MRHGDLERPDSLFWRVSRGVALAANAFRITSRGIALAAIGGMLAISILTIVDVTLRAAVNTPIPGFYELAELMMAVIIAACFPTVLATRNSLTVDFIGERLGRRTRALLGLAGALLLLGFLVILTWRFAIYAEGIASRNAETTTLLLPVSPFWWLVTVVCGFSAAVQTVIVLVCATEFGPGVRNAPARASDGQATERVVAAGLIAVVALAAVIVFTEFLPAAPLWWVIAAAGVIGAAVIGAVILIPAAAETNGEGQTRSAEDAARRGGQHGRDRPGAASGSGWKIATLLVAAIGVAAVVSLLLASPGDDPGWLAALTFAAMLGMIMLQVPLAAAMGLVGLAAVAAVTGDYAAGLLKLATDAGDLMIKLDLAAVPLFILMGGFASAAGVSADIYRLANAILGRFRGGLALATIGACAGFGAVTGSSVATAATMGRVSLPEMRRRGYRDHLATGCIAAGGTLGMLIPPSAIMVIYAVLADTSINKMFIAAIIPAAIATLFYMAVVFLSVRLSPTAAPKGEAAPASEIFSALLGAWSVLVLFGIVVGGIYGGFFDATEAAAVGAGVAFVFAWARKGLSAGGLWRVLEETATSTGMLYMIVVGAMAFAFFIGITQMPNSIVDWAQGLDLAPILVVAAILLLYIFLGAFMDPITMLLITVPVVLPLIQSYNYDLLWWGIMTVMVIEIGMITPPLGLNVFVIKSISGGTALTTVFRGIMPFLAADILRLLLFLLLPALVIWLPGTME